jgi:hypothetical protein
MALPAYDPEEINALARILARVALDELMNDMAADVEFSVSEPTMANAAPPGQEMCGVLKGLRRT